MSKGSLDLSKVEGGEVTMADGVDVKDTRMLDGEAMDSPVMNETNSTKKYTTMAQPKKNLGDS